MSSDRRINVRKRRVFYIPGYDPIHPRRYRELYRKEGARQAKISGYNIDLKAKFGDGPYGWHVFGKMDGFEVKSDVEVLVWSDIVRSSMSNSIPATYWQLVRTVWVYITSGAFRRLMWLRKGPVLAALYPVVMLLAQLLIAVIVYFVLKAMIIWLLSLVGAVGDWVEWVGLVPALAVAYATLWWFRSKDNKLYAYYLMHDYAFSARNGGANPSVLEDRMAEFADVIADALRGDADEVLVVGHSSGAHLAISILADLIRDQRVPEFGPELSFLSLGQVVPMVSFLPKAKRLRGDLHFLSTRDEITWVDVSAPGDGCSFALCDPVAVSGVAPPRKLWPLVISASFTQTLSSEQWIALRWRFFRLHFQYLCAFDRPKDYDYFQITAGPWTLGDRYRDRAPSVSRIDVSASAYTDMVA